MDRESRNFVQQRAGLRCEYWRIPETAYSISFHVEHIVASVHQRNEDPTNLAWACPRCNAFKGPNLTTIDPESGARVDLLNPRIEIWEEHFLMTDWVITGRTSEGRGTVHLLKLNEPRRLELRQVFMELGTS